MEETKTMECFGVTIKIGPPVTPCKIIERNVGAGFEICVTEGNFLKTYHAKELKRGHRFMERAIYFETLKGQKITVNEKHMTSIQNVKFVEFIVDSTKHSSNPGFKKMTTKMITVIPDYMYINFVETPISITNQLKAEDAKKVTEYISSKGEN